MPRRDPHQPFGRAGLQLCATWALGFRDHRGYQLKRLPEDLDRGRHRLGQGGTRNDRASRNTDTHVGDNVDGERDCPENRLSILQDHEQASSRTSLPEIPLDSESHTNIVTGKVMPPTCGADENHLQPTTTKDREKMKTLLPALLVSLCVASSLAADSPSNYLGAGLGVYFPESNDLKGFDAGFIGEVFAGRHFSRNLAAEIGVGYLSSNGPSGEYIGEMSGATWTGTFEVSAIPVTATILGILPLSKGEIFVGAGAGAYFSTIKAEMVATGYPSQSIEASDTPIGMHLRTGGRFDLAPKLSVGGELQYLVAGAEFSKTIGAFSYSRDFGLDGITARASLIYRF